MKQKSDLTKLFFIRKKLIDFYQWKLYHWHWLNGMIQSNKKIPLIWGNIFCEW